MFLHSLNSEYELLKASNEKESKGKTNKDNWGSLKDDKDNDRRWKVNK